MVLGNIDWKKMSNKHADRCAVLEAKLVEAQQYYCECITSCDCLVKKRINELEEKLKVAESIVMDIAYSRENDELSPAMRQHEIIISARTYIEKLKAK